MKKGALILAILLLGVAFLYEFNPTQYWFMPKCPFKMITGFSCPGCGIQRAIHALLHGNIAEAISYNYYLIYSGPYVTSFILLWIMPECIIRPIPVQFPEVLQGTSEA